MNGGDAENGPATTEIAPLRNVTEVWDALAAAAAAITAVAAGFLWQPPAFTLGPADTIPNAGRFIVAIVIALLAYPVLRLASSARIRTWLIVTATLLVVGAAGLFAYVDLTADWVRDAHGRHVVVGARLTPPAAAYQRTHSDATATDLLDAFSNDPEQVWTPDGMTHHALILSAFYLIELTILAATTLGAVQLVRCTLADS